MTPTRQGSIRLFRFAGIQVYLHWTWFILALYDFQTRGDKYSSPIWFILELVALFSIVLMHEFGHSLACRQVGGKANEIVLWPFGGVAYVSPPPRPAATLWSIAAGPLVNVILLPITILLWMAGAALGWADLMPNLYRFVETLMYMNVLLLVFNLMPVYPLDGGQIFQCLLWFFIGPARSLMAASIVGFIGVGGLLLWAMVERSGWLVFIAVFILLNCWGGLVNARRMARLAKATPHHSFACPGCGTPPPQGEFWRCGKCGKGFDTFDNRATCPSCGTQFEATRCFQCGGIFPIQQWERVSSFSEPPLREPPYSA